MSAKTMNGPIEYGDTYTEMARGLVDDWRCRTWWGKLKMAGWLPLFLPISLLWAPVYGLKSLKNRLPDTYKDAADFRQIKNETAEES